MNDAARSIRPHRARYRRILRFAMRQLVQLWWFEVVLPRVGMSRTSERSRPERLRRMAERFRVLAVDLGGLMIKVGQFLSSRLDVLPPEVTRALEDLQDEVPAEPFAAIQRRAEEELGIPLSQAYDFFEEVPLAAASLGQAHRARLSADVAADAGFEDVVVKVQRPGIEEIVEVDLDALRRVGRWLSRIRLVSDKVDAPALMEEFAQTTREEIDYLHEAASAERFAENFAADPRVAAPQIAWERSTRRVLTLSDVTAIKVNDAVALRAAGIDPAEVATAFAEAMFEQIFRHGFFHADPHPGNVFVTPDAAGWRLTFIDFGMMGEVPSGIREGLRTIVIALAARDSRRLIEGVKGVGALLPSADTREFEKAVTHLFARFGGMGFAEMSAVDPREFRDFGNEFGDVVRGLPFQFPEGFLLLMRAVSLTSGLCSSLDPDFNVWDAVEPYAAQLLRDESGNMVRDFAQEAMATAGVAWRLPQRIDGVVDRLEEGTLTFDLSRLERRMDWLIRLVRRAVGAVVFAGLLVGGALLVGVNPVVGTLLMIGSVVPLGYVLFAGIGRR